MKLRQHIWNAVVDWHDEHNPLPMWPLVTRKDHKDAQQRAFEEGWAMGAEHGGPLPNTSPVRSA